MGSETGSSKLGGERRMRRATTIDFEDLISRLKLDYGGYTDPMANVSETNEFQFIVSFRNPLPEGKFVANTPTVWAGIAPTPIADKSVDSPAMARVGVQATRETCLSSLLSLPPRLNHPFTRPPPPHTHTQTQTHTAPHVATPISI